MFSHETRDIIATILVVLWGVMLLNIGPMLVLEPDQFGRWWETVLALYLFGWGYLGSHATRHWLGADGD